MTDIAPLKNLNDLNAGTQKQWIWQRRSNYSKSCDYLQKIDYCIQDLNHEIDDLNEPSMKEVVYVIVLIDWIREAVKALPALQIEGLISKFVYPKQLEIDMVNKYFTAIRSFAVAHPLLTTRHQAYGFDGDKICVDIRNKTSVITQAITRNEDWFHLDINGLVSHAKDIPSDFVLYIYSKQSNNMKFFKYIGADFCDLYHVAELQIDKLYALDRYLGKLRRKDWL